MSAAFVPPTRLAVTTLHATRRVPAAIMSEMKDAARGSATGPQASVGGKRSSYRGRGGRGRHGKGDDNGNSGDKRLFIGLELPSSVVKQVHNAVLQSGLSGVRDTKVLPAETYHVTLHFLGACGIERVRRALARTPAADDNKYIAPILEGGREKKRDVSEDTCRGFNIRVKGLGVFPNRNNPRVLWAGAHADDNLVKLHRNIGAMLQGVDIAVEDNRNFHPHITLARFRHSNERHGRRQEARHTRPQHQQNPGAEIQHQPKISPSSSKCGTGTASEGTHNDDLLTDLPSVSHPDKIEKRNNSGDSSTKSSSCNTQQSRTHCFTGAENAGTDENEKHDTREMVRRAVAAFIKDYGDLDAGAFRVSEFILYESVLGKGTPVYEVRDRFPL